jgi:hypothetical protein
LNEYQAFRRQRALSPEVWFLQDSLILLALVEGSEAAFEDHEVIQVFRGLSPTRRQILLDLAHALRSAHGREAPEA